MTMRNAFENLATDAKLQQAVDQLATVATTLATIAQDLAGVLSVQGTVSVGNFPASQGTTGVYNAAPPVLDNGASAAMQLDVLGNQKVAVATPLPSGTNMLGGVTLLGDPRGDFAGLNILEELVDDAGDLKLGVRVANQPRQDAVGATVASDAVGSGPYVLGAGGAQFTLDTTGYQSLALQLTGSWSGVVSFYAYNNPSTPVAMVGWLTSNQFPTTVTGATSNGMFVFPVTGRLVTVKVTTYYAGQVVVTPYLRSTPFVAPAAGVNIATWANTLVQNAGTGGVVAAGGYIPVGYQWGQYNARYSVGTVTLSSLTASQSSVAPLLTSGLDQTGVVRALLTDMRGSLQVTQAPGSNAAMSVSELLEGLYAAARVQLFYLYSMYAAETGVTAAADEPDALLAEFLGRGGSLGSNAN